MIPNRWYAILESKEAKRAKPIGITRLGENLVLWRNELGEVACLRNLCAHRGAALSRGQIVDNCVECPFHGLQYNATGRCRLIPSIGKSTPVPEQFRVQAYPAREAHGLIWIWWGEPSQELPPLPFFEDIDQSFAYATFRDHWPVHYSRAVENQLDVAHLPFVHRNTIGRSGHALVDGPVVKADEKEIGIWVYNRLDDGTPARKTDEIPEPQQPPFVKFRFPNIWQLRLTERFRISIAFAPVDENNTVVYLRFYQSILRVPPLRKLLSWLGLLVSIVILRQDKRVVITQRPIRTDLRMDEKLTPSDRPIVAYRLHRDRLIERSK